MECAARYLFVEFLHQLSEGREVQLQQGTQECSSEQTQLGAEMPMVDDQVSMDLGMLTF